MPTVNYRPLGKALKRNGFRYRCVKRVGDVAIYEQFHRTRGHSVGFEVIRIRRHNGFTIAGIHIPPAETYPPSSAWGSHGWTFKAAEDAERKLREILGDTTADLSFSEDELAEIAADEHVIPTDTPAIVTATPPETPA